MNPSPFRISWVLQQELCLGPAPTRTRHLHQLRQHGVKAVLSLCSEDEAAPPTELHSWFNCSRLVLPDHNSGRAPTMAELEQAVDTLRQLRAHGPVFVHCVASVERSPLVCLAWLVREKGLSKLQALEYLTQQHPGTNPLPEQLALLD